MYILYNPMYNMQEEEMTRSLCQDLRNLHQLQKVSAPRIIFMWIYTISGGPRGGRRPPSSSLPPKKD